MTGTYRKPDDAESVSRTTPGALFTVTIALLIVNVAALCIFAKPGTRLATIRQDRSAILRILVGRQRSVRRMPGIRPVTGSPVCGWSAVNGVPAGVQNGPPRLRTIGSSRR